MSEGIPVSKNIKRPTILPTTEDMHRLRRIHQAQKTEVTDALTKSGITPAMESYQGTRRNFTRALTERELELDNVRNELQAEQSARSATEQALEKADTDMVTGVYTRNATERRLNEAAKWLQQHGNPESTLAFIDLNGVKKFNDTEGHEAGDKYLRTAAQILREISRDTDIVGRYGGDEFVVLLQGTPLKKTLGWIMKVKKAYAEQGVSASMGFATFDPHNVEQTVKNADDMMYRTKKAWYGQKGQEPR